jgi:hypothetical protein
LAKIQGGGEYGEIARCYCMAVGGGVACAAGVPASACAQRSLERGMVPERPAIQ